MTCARNYVNCMSRRAGDAAKVSPMFRNNAASVHTYERISVTSYVTRVRLAWIKIHQSAEEHASAGLSDIKRADVILRASISFDVSDRADQAQTPLQTNQESAYSYSASCTRRRVTSTQTTNAEARVQSSDVPAAPTFVGAQLEAAGCHCYTMYTNFRAA